MSSDTTRPPISRTATAMAAPMRSGSMAEMGSLPPGQFEERQEEDVRATLHILVGREF